MPFIERIYNWIVRSIYMLDPVIKAAILRLLMFYLLAAILMTISRRHWHSRSRGLQSMLFVTGFFCSFAIPLELFEFPFTAAYAWFFCIAFGAILVLPAILGRLLVPSEAGQRRTILILYIATVILIGIEYI